MIDRLSFLISLVIARLGVFFFVAWLLQGKGPGLSKDFPLKFRLLTSIRTLLLMFILVPLSFCRNVHMETREFLGFYLKMNNPEGHKERCDILIQQIKRWNAEGRPCRLCTASPNWAAMSMKRSSNKGNCALISTTHLNHILKIDEDNLTITCEPGVCMGQITQALVHPRLALKCQIKMESLMIGGISSGWC